MFERVKMKIKKIFCLLSFALFMIAGPAAADNDVDRLIAAMLADTPVIDDLHALTDRIGGRLTGTDCGLNRSSQHIQQIFLQANNNPKFFWASH